MEIKSSTFDNVKKEYEYKLDPYNRIYFGPVVYAQLYHVFVDKYEEYEQYKKELKEILDNKRDIIDKSLFELYEKTLNEMSDDCEKMRKQIEIDYDTNELTLGGISYDYNAHIDKPGASDMYLTLCKDIIDKEVKIYIHYHKKLILYNDEILNIKKKLIN